jgi:hypothetical protein
MRRGVLMHVSTDYALNWLAEHGEMPSGVHACRAIRGISFCSSPLVVLVNRGDLRSRKAKVALRKLCFGRAGRGGAQEPSAP